MLIPWKKSDDKPRQHIKKQKRHFADKGHHSQSQSFGFSSSHVRVLELDHKEGWAPKYWYFWTMALEKALESLLDSQSRSNQSILKEINPEYSLEGLMLQLKLQYFGHLMPRTDSFEKTLMLGKIEGGRRSGNRGWDGWMASSTQWTWVWVNSGSWWWTGRPGVLQSMQSQTVEHDWATEPILTDWILRLNYYMAIILRPY